MKNDRLKKIIINSIHDVEFQRFILFGSRARNDYNKDSNYDLLIVLKNKISQRKKIKLSTLIRRNLAINLIDADIILKQKNEIDYYKDKAGSIVRNAMEEGITQKVAKKSR